MIRLVIAIVAVAGCIHDHYECQQDSDCDLGAGGRCEIDHHCTHYDPTCPTLRRYSAHAEALTDVCFDGRATPLDLCAPGQPPALPEGCAKTVCDALPACCATGWSEACVLEAEQDCDLVCDTRIAITAQKGAKTELWDLRFDGAHWSATPRLDRITLLGYLAPAPGTTEPRVAGFVAPASLMIEGPAGQTEIAIDPNHQYHDLVSLDLERDLRDTMVLDWQDAMTSTQNVEVIKIDTGAIRDIDTGVSVREAWGDYDHDAYPDGVAATGARYTLLVNIDPGDHTRQIDASISSTFGGMNTPSSTANRSFSWVDLDGDGRLDLVAFGNQVRVHAGEDRISDNPIITIDCDPPVTLPNMTCDTTTSANAAWSGATVPAKSGPFIIAASFPTRALYRITPHENPSSADIVALTLPPTLCVGCAIQAVVVRDLDGDHALDIVAIDSSLTLYVALSGKGMTFVEQQPISTVTTGFTSVRTSVTGAVR